MRVVPVNEAEAIIETFFGACSDESTGKSVADEYTVEIMPEAAKTQGLAAFGLCWHGIEARFDKMPAGGCYVQVSRPCNVSIEGYDVFRLFAAVSSALKTDITAVIDGKEQVLVQGLPGNDDTCEIEAPICGQCLNSLTIRYTMVQDKTCNAVMHWMGLANAARQKEMERRPSAYDATWTDCLYPDDRYAEYSPRLGILFDDAGLKEIREKVKTGYLKEMFEKLRALANEDLKQEPEKDIGLLAPHRDRRWMRTRDMEKQNTSGMMKRLAFVGLVDRNPAMCRMAARMALSVSHCTYWCESVMGLFPGNSWHHRSFTEEVYCSSCALVLDWCGGFLTTHGIDAIEDAIIMKGLTRIESDFKRMEYIRTMNQGIVFSSGRIFGMLGVVQHYPRYKGLIEEAERDLHEMVGAYVQSDGGTSEGPGYWNFTFGTAMPIFYALSRFHGVAFKQYATPTLVKTGEYAKRSLSIQNGGYCSININDAHSSAFQSSLMAAYYVLTGDEDYKQILCASIAGGGSEPDLNLIILAPAGLEPCQRFIKYGFSNLPVTGQTRIVRTLQERDVNLHMVSGIATSGHYHKDKGSFILETDREGLCIDRGVTGYWHPETTVMQHACYHNLFYPELPQGRIALQLPKIAPICDARYEENTFLYATDTTQVWEDGLFTRCVRRVISPDAGLYLFDDEAILCRPMEMSFRVNSTAAVQKEGSGVRICAKENDVVILPLTQCEVTVEQKGIDEHLLPVNLVRVVSPCGVRHRLCTALFVLKKGAALPTVTCGEATLGKAGVAVQSLGDNSITVCCTKADGSVCSAVYADERWTVQAQ